MGIIKLIKKRKKENDNNNVIKMIYLTVVFLMIYIVGQISDNRGFEC